MKISDKTHDRIIHQIADFEHELEAVADEHEFYPCPLRLTQAQAKLDGAREIFAILNGNI